jgi:hypothetical protein
MRRKAKEGHLLLPLLLCPSFLDWGRDVPSKAGWPGYSRGGRQEAATATEDACVHVKWVVLKKGEREYVAHKDKHTRLLQRQQHHDDRPRGEASLRGTKTLVSPTLFVQTLSYNSLLHMLLVLIMTVVSVFGIVGVKKCDHQSASFAPFGFPAPLLPVPPSSSMTERGELPFAA